MEIISPLFQVNLARPPLYTHLLLSHKQGMVWLQILAESVIDHLTDVQAGLCL